MKRYALIAVCAILLSPSAEAEITVGAYRALKAKGGDDWSAAKTYVNGFGVGYAFANVQLSMRHANRLYCPPNNLAFEADNYLALIDEALIRYKPTDSIYIEAILTSALTRLFPCNETTKRATN
jgi:hypothetical protein